MHTRTRTTHTQHTQHTHYIYHTLHTRFEVTMETALPEQLNVKLYSAYVCSPVDSTPSTLSQIGLELIRDPVTGEIQDSGCLNQSPFPISDSTAPRAHVLQMPLDADGNVQTVTPGVCMCKCSVVCSVVYVMVLCKLLLQVCVV